MSAKGSITATATRVYKTYKVVPVRALTLSIADTFDVAFALIGTDAATPKMLKA
jgi:hypothetical protein